MEGSGSEDTDVLNIDRYVELAKEMGAKDALLISVDQVVFDPRTYLKCRWGCPEYGKLKCASDGPKPWESEKLLRRYKKAVLIHTNDTHLLNKIAYDVEQKAFFDGYYFAFALYHCECRECNATSRQECLHPWTARPGEDYMGIDVFKTVKNLGLPLRVLKEKGEVQDRYAFVFID